MRNCARLTLRCFLQCPTAHPAASYGKTVIEKTVTVDYSDDTFEHVWTESLELALQARDSDSGKSICGLLGHPL